MVSRPGDLLPLPQVAEERRGDVRREEESVVEVEEEEDDEDIRRWVLERLEGFERS